MHPYDHEQYMTAWLQQNWWWELPVALAIVMLALTPLWKRFWLKAEAPTARPLVDVFLRYKSPRARLIAIRVASYIYFAVAVIFVTAFAVSIANAITDPLDWFAVALFAAFSVYCVVMARKSRAYLRSAPVPSRKQVLIGLFWTFFLGQLGGLWLLAVFAIPYLLLVWAIE